MTETRQIHSRIDISQLPDITQAEMTFYESSFFQHHSSRELPDPEFVLAQVPRLRAGVVKFQHLGLAVKFGFDNELRLEEAQALHAVRHAFPLQEVPVPELFGWKHHDGRNFIYMSLIEGETLQEAWPSLTLGDKESICARLSRIISSLQQITRDISSDALICKHLPVCSINGGIVQDRFFRFDYEGGPFKSIQAYNNWLLAAAIRQTPQLVGSMDGPYRECFPDDGKVYFTHGDLTITNIMVSKHSDLVQVTGIVDWEQAGWYPEYWERCKLLCGVDYEHEWREAGWADKVMNNFESEWAAFSEYLLWRCP